MKIINLIINKNIFVKLVKKNFQLEVNMFMLNNNIILKMYKVNKIHCVLYEGTYNLLFL